MIDDLEDLELSRREAIGGGASALALWMSTRVAAAQSGPEYPADVCTIVGDVHPTNEPDVTDDGCKVYIEVETGSDSPEPIYYTVKGQSGWTQINPSSDTQWSDTDGDNLLELPGDDGIDIDNGKVRNAPSAAEDIVRRTDVAGVIGDHKLGGSEHDADTLANLNSKVSDATLDDTGDARPPTQHDHSGDNLNPQSVVFSSPNTSYTVESTSDLLRVESATVSGDVFAIGPAGIQHRQTGTLTQDTTVSDYSQIVMVDSSGGSVNITLGGNLERDGLPMTVTDVGGAASTNSIDISAGSGANIDGSSTLSITEDYGGVGLFFDTTTSQWYTGAGVL